MVGLASLVPLALAILMILGAARMKRLEAYGLGVTASVLALLPIHPWFILGLPMGIWGLVVLSRRETRDGFRDRQRLGGGHASGGPAIPGNG